MGNKSFFNMLMQHTGKPEGFWGRFMLRGMNIGHTPVSAWGLSHIEKWHKNWTILDIGCGGGANIKRMLKHCPDGKVYGMDMSAESIRVAARHNWKEFGKRCFIEKGDAADLPYGKNSFDLVTAFETIYFWKNPADCFKGIYRILKPGGLFLICNEMDDPTDTTWTGRIENMRIYSGTEISSFLKAAGFSDIRLHGRKRNICIISVKDTADVTAPADTY